ncbi:MAG: MSMEG_1061 family FMN-dependent PPOX-type flavoprotein [Actinomycetota bacterium]
MPFDHALSTAADLRSVYRDPSKPSLAKQIDHLDEHCEKLIRHSPFVLLATSSSDGRVDVSPRGGRPGFVCVLDEHRLAIPDLAGNNRLDSMQNLVESPGVGLLFCIPGLDETLRVNGTATITTDPEVLDACADDDLHPKVAIGVDVDEVFIHCAKALRRSRLWHSEDWPDLSDMPTVACMLQDHYDLPELDLPAIEARLADAYERTTWMVGGDS